MPATNGSPPTDRVNGRRFSRPFHVFQARPRETKGGQNRPMVFGSSYNDLFVPSRLVLICLIWATRCTKCVPRGKYISSQSIQELSEETQSLE